MWHCSNSSRSVLGEGRKKLFRISHRIVISSNWKKEDKCLPPYVPAKSKALKNISGSNSASNNGGNKVIKYGSGLLCPVGSFSTATTTKIRDVQTYGIMQNFHVLYMCILINMLLGWACTQQDLRKRRVGCTQTWWSFILKPIGNLPLIVRQGRLVYYWDPKQKIKGTPKTLRRTKSYDTDLVLYCWYLIIL